MGRQALLLTHPRPQTRDTQYYAYKHKVVKSNRIALRVLALQELGVAIQGGEHSSVRPFPFRPTAASCPSAAWSSVGVLLDVWAFGL